MESVETVLIGMQKATPIVVFSVPAATSARITQPYDESNLMANCWEKARLARHYPSLADPNGWGTTNLSPLYKSVSSIWDQRRIRRCHDRLRILVKLCGLIANLVPQGPWGQQRPKKTFNSGKSPFEDLPVSRHSNQDLEPFQKRFKRSIHSPGD